MDFITLWISALLSGRQRSALRMSLAAALGALYGVLSVVFSVGGALTYILAGAVSIVMCLIAFGTGGGIFSLFKQSALIWGCGALLGGVMTALLSLGKGAIDSQRSGGGMLSLFAAASVVITYVTVRIICLSRGKGSVMVRARWCDREISFSALCDSGNLMRDPLGGDAVIPVSCEVVARLCGKALTDAMLAVDNKILCDSGLSVRIIPHRTDGESGIVCGFIPDSVTVISGKKKKAVRCVLVPRKCKKDHYAGCAGTIPTLLLP